MESPILQALVLADHVYQDVITGKKVIAGTFNQLYADKFPNQLAHPTFTFVSITGVRGKVPLALEFVSLKTNKVLMRLELTVSEENPLRTVEMVIQIPTFPMPEEGVYLFQILHDEVSLGSLRILVNKVPQADEDQT